MSTVNRYRIYCETEAAYVYVWNTIEPTACPNNNGHTITISSIIVIQTISSVGEFDDNMRLLTNNGSTYTQFGEQRITQYSPLFQNYSLYNIINSQIYRILTDNGGTIVGDSNGTELDLNITTTVGSYAVLRTAKVCKYRPGYNLMLRWNTLFASPIDNLFQFAGLGNNGSDIYFCYNGTDFGVRYSTNGRAEIRQLTITSSALLVGNATVTLNGVAFSVPLTASLGSTAFTAYEIAKFSYTGWIVINIGSVVNFVSRSVGEKNGTYSFSHTSAAGTFAQTKAGQDLTTTFISRTNWNGSSRMVQDLDPTKRNMYSINYSWYGSGNMIFKIYNPDLQIYDVVHTIKFSNIQTSPSLSQPNMYLQQGIASLGSTTAKTVRVAGGFGAIEGPIVINFPLYGITNSVSIAANTQTCLLALKPRDSILGFVNNSEILIKQISVSTNGNRSVRLRVIRNPTTLSAGTTGDYLAWNYISQTESISLIDTNSRTFTGGVVVATYFLPNTGSLLIDLTSKEINVFKDDIVIFAVNSVLTNDVDIALTILEDY